jgi:hypothetical protein
MVSPRSRSTTSAALGALALASLCLVLPACQGDGQICLFGYSSRPNYDTHIKTVRVPIFKNATMWRGLEFQLTQAVVREIEAKTPYKVVSDASCADTELTGTIVSFNKSILNRTQLNEIREAQTALGVEVVWKDLRTGEILSKPKPPGTIAPAVPPMIAPNTLADGRDGPPLAILPPVPAPPPPAGAAPPPPVLVQSLGDFIPEIGGSITTAQQQNVDRLAIQIVSMMEIPW